MRAAGFLMLALAAQAEIIDRIAISAGKQVITESQIVEEIRVTAFLNQQPVKINAEEKRNAAERLLEQTLMRRDMEFTHYPLPALAAADTTLSEVRIRYSTEAAFQDDLGKYGITEDELRQHLWWQLTMLGFIDYRFRPAIQVSDTEIRDYYAKRRTEWEQQGAARIPTLEESRGDIEKILTGERVDQAVDRWLGDARTRLNIQYHEEAFQ
jgi:hypothetical protein